MILAVAESQDIESDLLPKIATGFCSGLARTGGLCGALSGAILGLNLRTGRNNPEASTEENYALVGDLIHQFETRFGSINCRQLTGCDLGTAEGLAAFRANNKIEACLLYAEEATKMALSLLEEAEIEKPDSF